MRLVLIYFLFSFSIFSFGQKGNLALISEQHFLDAESLSQKELILFWVNDGLVGQVGQYEKMELAIALPEATQKRLHDFVYRKLSRGLNPFNPEEVDVYAEITHFAEDGTTAETERKYAFYYSEFERDTTGHIGNWDWVLDKDRSGFRLRFSPQDTGRYLLRVRASIEGGEAIESGQFFFDVTPTDHPGFIQVGPNKRYLQYQNGETFFPIGGNIPPDYANDKRWKSEEMKKALKGGKYSNSGFDGKGRTYHPLFYTSYLKTMDVYADAGANYLRLMHLPWSTDIEYEELNNYSGRMHMAWELDRLVEKAAERNLKIEWCIQSQYTLENPGHYGHFSWDWPTNDVGCKEGNNQGYCYQEELGLQDPIEFFRHEDAQKYWKYKLRYILARWGYSTDIALFQLISEINGTGVRSHYKLHEEKNNKGVVTGSWCVTDKSKSSFKPYYDQEGYADAIYHWQIEMFDYAKRVLRHDQHLFGPSYAGEPEPTLGDSTFFHPLVDVNSFNNYSPQARKYYLFVDQSEEFHSGVFNAFSGKKSSDLKLTQKPFVFSEIGMGKFYRCDLDIGDTKTVLISPFIGLSGMAMNWDNSRFSRGPNWHLYGHVNRYLKGVNLSNIPWIPQCDELSTRDVNFKAEMVGLVSEEKHKRAIGAVHNRTWNYHTVGGAENPDSECTDPNYLGAVEEEVRALSTYRDVNYEYPYGPYPLVLKKMGVKKKYIIEWTDPFTEEVVFIDKKRSSFSGKLNLEYPRLSTDDGSSPIYWFKAWSIRFDTFD